MPRTRRQIPTSNQGVKLCKKCGEERTLNQFYADKSKSDGLQSNCIPCRKEIKGIAQRDRERELERKRKKICNSFKSHWSKFHSQWTKTSIYKNWAKEEHRRKGRVWAKNNPELVRRKKERWAKNNPHKVREARKRQGERYRTDPKLKLMRRIRSRTYFAIKNKSWEKNCSATKLLGCSRDIFKAHIESQFKKGMNWENIGEWHIDHIIPLSSAKSMEEIKKLAHFTNLQPLWASENLSKAAKIQTCQPELLLTY